MKYSAITESYEKIEVASKRLEMTNYLVELIKKTPKDLIREVAYLTQGKIYPDFMGIELGIAEKMVVTSISKASTVSKEETNTLLNKIGDLGLTAEKLLSARASKQLQSDFGGLLTLEEVYETLDNIAKTTGKGAVKSKVDLLTKLIIKATPKEARYLIRTVTGKLRLGVGDMTFLDALAIAYTGRKTTREVVERAYNMCSDLGLVSEILANQGISGIKNVGITVGRPVRPMLCERLTTAEDILEKLGGKGAAEFKYDGLRIQAHISPSEISLFSRRLENMTSQFPDITRALRKSVDANRAIVEGECVAVNSKTGELQPFQVLTQRRGRKYKIQEKVAEVPAVLALFDVLYIEDQTFVDRSYLERRKVLEKIVRETEKIWITPSTLIDKPEDLNTLMETATESGCEGLVVKSVRLESIYQAGARGFLWIKYKREYWSEMTDTIDLVIIGAFAGRGKRAGTYGALLMAAYDEKTDSFKTVCKLGTGFDDYTLDKLPKVLNDYQLDHIHARVDSKIKADYWFTPAKVLEVHGAELTLSPSHTCGSGTIKKGSGLAVRFPRFTGKWREDKAPEDVTKVSEIVSMYKAQLKQIK